MFPPSPADPVNCDIDFDTSNCTGKTAIVTGGASGLGEVYVRALASAGVAVCIADFNAQVGEKLAAELTRAKFVQCDVTKWEDQLRLFQEAQRFSPSGKIHFVIANAGIARKDEVFSFDGDEVEPRKPSLNIIDVNLHGALYTVKLALHYFVKQNGTTKRADQDDQCLILIGSGAAYFDALRGVQYAATKWGMRGIMHAIRRVLPHCGSRINMISPWYVRTKILSEETFDHVKKSGVEFAEAEDGGQCLLRILSDRSINGRSLFLSARKWAPRGYMDLDFDDYPGNKLAQEIQVDQMRASPAELGLFVS